MADLTNAQKELLNRSSSRAMKMGLGDRIQDVENASGTGDNWTGTNVTAAGSVSATTTLTSLGPTSGVGYATGAGGAVTQATNRTTPVTLSKVCGTITTDDTSLAAGAAATFTVTNTAVAITDTIALSVQSGLTTVQTNVRVTTVTAGTFKITVENNHASTAETGAILINFAVIKGVVA